jgi:hypothetical protein
MKSAIELIPLAAFAALTMLTSTATTVAAQSQSAPSGTNETREWIDTGAKIVTGLASVVVAGIVGVVAYKFNIRQLALARIEAAHKYSHLETAPEEPEGRWNFLVLVRDLGDKELASELARIDILKIYNMRSAGSYATLNKLLYESGPRIATLAHQSAISHVWAQLSECWPESEVCDHNLDFTAWYIHTVKNTDNGAQILPLSSIDPVSMLITRAINAPEGPAPPGTHPAVSKLTWLIANQAQDIQKWTRYRPSPPSTPSPP